MCLTCQKTEKDPIQGIPLSVWMGRAMEKDWPKKPSGHQLQEARKKDSDRAITPAVEAVCVPEHSVLPVSLQAKQLHHLHGQLSLGQSCHRQKKKKKKKSCVYVGKVTSVLSSSLRPARLLCQRGGSPGKNTGVYWPIQDAIAL